LRTHSTTKATNLAPLIYTNCLTATETRTKRQEVEQEAQLS